MIKFSMLFVLIAILFSCYAYENKKNEESLYINDISPNLKLSKETIKRVVGK